MGRHLTVFITLRSKRCRVDLRRTLRSGCRDASAGFVVLLLLFGVGCAELANLELSLPRLPGLPGVPLDEGTVAAGLREALEVGSARASAALSRPGGFSEDALLRISLPEELDDVARALRTVGFASQVDALELSMNRAAEAAVGEAVPIFAAAIESMTIADAFAILNGNETAASDYFRVRTNDALRARFEPVAERGMREVGLYDSYRQVRELYERIPFVTMPAPDLERYVADQALSGLFAELAKEEEKIRADPAAQTTDLLRRVFGR